MQIDFIELIVQFIDIQAQYQISNTTILDGLHLYISLSLKWDLKLMFQM